MPEHSFEPTVTDYVNVNKHDRGKKIINYIGVKRCLGPDCGLTRLKNATKVCKARYNVTKNPFIVNHWFDIFDETVKKLGIEDRPDFIWTSYVKEVTISNHPE